MFPFTKTTSAYRRPCVKATLARMMTSSRAVFFMMGSKKAECDGRSGTLIAGGAKLQLKMPAHRFRLVLQNSSGDVSDVRSSKAAMPERRVIARAIEERSGNLS